MISVHQLRLWVFLFSNHGIVSALKKEDQSMLEDFFAKNMAQVAGNPVKQDMKNFHERDLVSAFFHEVVFFYFFLLPFSLRRYSI